MRILLALPIVLVTAAAAAQLPPLTPPSMAGRDLYEFYCASCHGKDGRGNGPIAPMLKTPPTDLTTIGARSHGVFPRAYVEGYVTNSSQLLTPAHGTAEMPIWGPIFYALDPSDTRARIRVENVVGYVETLQRTP